MRKNGNTNQASADLLDEKLKTRLMTYPNVTDVGIGVKMKGGNYIPGAAVVVYVNKKLPHSQLPIGGVIPKKIKGLPTDVQEELDPALFIVSDTTGLDLTRVRPLRSGIAISNSAATDHAGTLGCFAMRNSDQKKVLVSNYHVIFRNKGMPGIDEGDHKVYQPREEEHNLVAKVPATNAGSIGGSVDCAYAVLEEEGSSCCCKHVIAHENKLASIQFRGVASAVREQKVFKTGIATGATVGKVVNTSKDITGAISYADYFLPAGDSFTFTNLIMIVFWDEAANNYDPTRQFSEGGDSGSAIYNENNEIIGLHFGSHFNPANGRHYSFACHIELVETQLGLTIPGTRNYTAMVPPPPASPALAALDLPVDSSEGEFVLAGSPQEDTGDFDNFWPRFREHLETTELGRLALQVIADHGYEIMRLINRNREVTVTWHRKQGPAFTAAIARSAKKPDYRIPVEINNQSFPDLMQQMGTVLHRHGSEELRQAIDAHLPLLMKIAEGIAQSISLTEMLAQLDTIQTNPLNHCQDV